MSTEEFVQTSYASLSIRGDIDPDAMDAETGLVRSRGFKKGDAFSTRSESHTRAFGLWVLSTETMESSEEPGKHLETLFKIVNPVLSTIRSIATRSGAEIRLRIGIDINYSVAAFCLPPSILAEMARAVDGVDISCVTRE